MGQAWRQAVRTQQGQNQGVRGRGGPPSLGLWGYPLGTRAWGFGQLLYEKGPVLVAGTGPIVGAIDPHAVGGGRATWVGLCHRGQRKGPEFRVLGLGLNKVDYRVLKGGFPNTPHYSLRLPKLPPSFPRYLPPMTPPVP